MGAGQSTEDGSGPKSQTTLGYHVLKVTGNSPAENAGLEPFFDYLVGINGVALEQETSMLSETMTNYENREVKLLVYNTKAAEFRGT